MALLGRLAALAAVYAFFAVLTPGAKGFMSDANTQLMLQDIAVVAMAAIGMTIVIIAGGIDLSVGSMVVLSAALGTTAMNSLIGNEWSEGSAVALGALATTEPSSPLPIYGVLILLATARAFVPARPCAIPCMNTERPALAAP
jgi:ribose/xylose/arabinose/galactoside ABC-type transport system permease subunit